MLYDPNWAPPATEIKLERWQEILLKAADLIENKGWCQGAFRNGDRFCAAGAMRAAAGHKAWDFWPPVDDAQFSTAVRKLRVNLGFTVVTTWNDALDRTKEEVVAKLREVAHAV